MPARPWICTPSGTQLSLPAAFALLVVDITPAVRRQARKSIRHGLQLLECLIVGLGFNKMAANRNLAMAANPSSLACSDNHVNDALATSTLPAS